MKCSQCGYELRDGARFCPECGAGQTSKCISCGFVLKPGAVFCGECGTKVIKNSDSTTGDIKKIAIDPSPLILPEVPVRIIEVNAIGPDSDDEFAVTMKYHIDNKSDQDWGYFETAIFLFNAAGQIIDKIEEKTYEFVGAGKR